MNSLLTKALIFGMAAFLTGCSLSPTSSIPGTDSGPTSSVDLDSIPEITPQPVTRTRAGNFTPYTVLGKTYEVLDSSEGFVEEGIASWYGSKFHGRLTSNGERFDMYALTAAHKHLPIPTYAQVTNLENGQNIVVRINDRGPFHSDRSIDLSWAAAAKLGFAEHGTAPVRIVTLDTDNPQSTLAQLSGKNVDEEPEQVQIPEQYALTSDSYYQVALMSQKSGADTVAAEVEAFTELPVRIAQEQKESGLLYRVLIGPLLDRREAIELGTILELAGLSPGFLVQLPGALLGCDFGQSPGSC